MIKTVFSYCIGSHDFFLYDHFLYYRMLEKPVSWPTEPLELALIW